MRRYGGSPWNPCSNTRRPTRTREKPYSSRSASWIAPSRITSALRVFAEGSRAGVALDALMRSYRDVNESLMADYQARQEALTVPEGVPGQRRTLRYVYAPSAPRRTLIFDQT